MLVLSECLKAGDKIRFYNESKYADLDKILNEKNLYNSTLEVIGINKEIKKFVVDGIDIPINFNDTFDIEKFNDLERKMDKLKLDRYVCYSVKDLAYKVADEVLGNGNDLFIDYMLVNDRNNIYNHLIAFWYKGCYCVVNLRWSNNALIIYDYYLTDNIEGFEDIEVAIEE